MSLHQIVCLANSYKHNNRCVAGVSLGTKKWVRLVGSKVQGCLTIDETCYVDGSEAEVLDVFEAELGENCSSRWHPEDVSVTGKRWRPVRRFDSQGDTRFLEAYLNKGPAILGGYGDRVYARKFEKTAIDKSLELIHPDDLWWWIREEGGKRKNRAIFRIGHVVRARYDLALTDPRWIERLRSMAPGIYPPAAFFERESPRTLFTMSLSEPFEGFHYKLVAGVLALPD
jgi:hypothetical protein